MVDERTTVMRVGTVERFTKRDGQITGVVLQEFPGEYLNIGRDKERQLKSWLVKNMKVGQKVRIFCGEWQGRLYINQWEEVNPAEAELFPDTYEDDVEAIPAPARTTAATRPAAAPSRTAAAPREPQSAEAEVKLAQLRRAKAFELAIQLLALNEKQAATAFELAALIEEYLVRGADASAPAGDALTSGAADAVAEAEL